MTQSSAHDITKLLVAWHGGDDEALNKLTSLVCEELHQLAHHYMHRERGDNILQTTALVNEAFIRLVDARKIDWCDRSHFFAISAILMRRVLVDSARSRRSKKRDPCLQSPDLIERLSVLSDRNLVALDDALSALSEFDPLKARLVELKYFGGMTMDEIAEELKVSREKVKRQWRLAKSWLYCEMKDKYGSRTLEKSREPI